ncbi:SdrD B-like domain-containing protein [Lentzea sp. NPDC060358]|uniref:SdrD B-like domain-containing protein n=1 Tax=Lentzea sp. NPDC060358 TaxID=3347103 RepID=UPI00366730BC
MSRMIRAAAVTVATSLVAVPLALSGTAFAQDENRPTSYIGGSVFIDLNGDDVKQDGEAGLKDVNVVVKGPDGKAGSYPTDAYGTWTMKYVASGSYEVSYVDPKFGGTTPSSVEVDVTDDSGHSVSFGVRGGSICGVAWKDENSDGRRQAGEGPLAGRLVSLHGTDRQVETGADGVYCFDGLAAGRYSLFSHTRQNDALVLTRGGGGSKFDWASGISDPVAVAKGQQVTGIDAGYLTPRADQKAVQIVVNRNGATDATDFQVGDVVEIYGSVAANGNVPESLGGILTLPEGLRIEATVGGLGQNAAVVGQQVHVAYGPKTAPGLVEFAGARVVVEKAFAGGEIKWEVRSPSVDTDLTNNVLTRRINARSAQPQGGAPVAAAPPVTKTAALASTGADPVAAGAIGLGAVVLGGLAVFGARRRRQA